MIVLAGLIVLATTGCLYPGFDGERPADFAGLGMIAYPTNEGIRFQLPARQKASPQVRPPTSLALARVQQSGGRGVRSYHFGAADSQSEWIFYDSSSCGGFEIDDDLHERLDRLPLLEDAFHVEPVITSRQQSEPLMHSLRRGALNRGAGLLLLYTFDSKAETSDGIFPLDIATLGLLPDVVASAETTCHAVLIDAQSGYIYAHAESGKDTWQLASQWTRDEAREDALRRAECRAFERMMDAFEPMWNSLAATYGWR